MVLVILKALQDKRVLFSSKHTALSAPLPPSGAGEEKKLLNKEGFEEGSPYKFNTINILSNKNH